MQILAVGPETSETCIRRSIALKQCHKISKNTEVDHFVGSVLCIYVCCDHYGVDKLITLPECFIHVM